MQFDDTLYTDSVVPIGIYSLHVKLNQTNRPWRIETTRHISGEEFTCNGAREVTFTNGLDQIVVTFPSVWEADMFADRFMHDITIPKKESKRPAYVAWGIGTTIATIVAMLFSKYGKK